MPFKTYRYPWELAPVMRLLLPFILGICLYEAILASYLSPTIVLCCIVAAFLFFVFSGLLSLSKPGYQKLFFVAQNALVILVACGICFLQRDKSNTAGPGETSDGNQYDLVYVSASPIEKEKTLKYEVSFLKIPGDKGRYSASGKALLYVYKADSIPSFHFGDTLLVRDHWQSIQNSKNPYAFDYHKFAARKNIFCQQFTVASGVILYGSYDSTQRSFVQNAHQYCLSSINQYITDSTANALLKAMLIGEEQDIDPNVRQAYSDTGIIHIISISGAHVAMLFLAVSFCFRWLHNKKYAWIKFLICLCLVWFYVVLAGASTPALRAAVMFTIVSAGSLAGKQSNPLNQLCTAAFLMLLVQPMWLFVIGFQLSFIAVLSLIIFYQPLLKLWHPENKLLQYFAKGIAASIAAEILVAPLVAFYFHSFPPMFIVANSLAGLAMGAILCLGMILFIVAKIAFAAKIIALLITVLSQAFHYFIFALQCFNIPALKVIFLSSTGLVLLYLFIGSFSWFMLRKYKPALWISLAFLLTFSMFSLRKSREIAGQKMLIMYNSNKTGQCELINGNTFSVLHGEETENFTTKAAHIGFGATQKVPDYRNRIFIQGKNYLLVADSNINLKCTFPVTTLLIASQKKRSDAMDYVSAFSPNKIVLSNRINAWQQKDWDSVCKQLGIEVHHTKTEGAFIFSANY